MNPIPKSPDNNLLSFLISAPGKVILYGEHSVVHNKLAIAASLGLRTYLHFSECSLTNITIEIPAVNLMHSIDFKVVQELFKNDIPLNSSQSNDLDLVDLLNHNALVTIIQQFIRKHSSCQFNDQQFTSLTGIFYLLLGILFSTKNVKPFTLKIETDLTLSAGMGSSASFAVVTAACFLHYKNLKSSNDNLKTFSDVEKSLISKWAYCIEKISHGSPSGIDNTICTYGSMVKFRRSDGMEFFTTNEFKLLLIDTKIARSTKKLVSNVTRLVHIHPLVTNSILNTMDEIAKSAVTYLNEISNDMENEELHQKLGELTDMSQCMLHSLGVSHPKLDQICALLKTSGLCGKLTGGGGGGYAISIIPPYIPNSVLTDLFEQLSSEGFKPILTKLGGLGVTIH